jgi:hypothetical protein
MMGIFYSMTLMSIAISSYTNRYNYCFSYTWFEQKEQLPPNSIKRNATKNEKLENMNSFSIRNVFSSISISFESKPQTEG